MCTQILKEKENNVGGAQLVEWLPRVHEALAPKTLGVAMHTYSPNTGRVKSSRSSSVTQGTPMRHCLKN